MDTSRKSLRGKVCCNNCLYFKKKRMNGLTLSIGKCILKNAKKKRTEKCDNCFTYKSQLSFWR